MEGEIKQITWSAPLVAVRSARKLEGDKILLPQSALEQLLAASTTTGPSSSHTFTAFDPFNPYSVAAARQERSHFQETFQQLPHPLMFQLVNQKNSNAVFAGIREFSAKEGEVVLSPYLMESLGIEEADLQDEEKELLEKESLEKESEIVDLTMDESDEIPRPKNLGLQITVKARQLPKGTYVRIRPLEAGYDPDDWKALLERQLRASYTTLTKGSILTVQGVKGEEFRFLVDKFAPDGDGICVVDTDLEVDIEPLNEEQARNTLAKIAAKAQRTPGTQGGSSVGHKIDIWKDVEGQVLPGDYVDYELPSWDKSRAVEIKLTSQDEEEIDLFVSPKSNRQRAPPRDSEHVFAEISSPKDGVKTIRIPHTNVELEGIESLLISVYGFTAPGVESGSAPRRYKLHAKAAEQNGSSSAPIDLMDSPKHTADKEQCKNCLQWIPKRTMFLHENFCLRNNILCPQCKDVFQKSSAEWANHWHCPTHPAAYGSSPVSKAKHDHYEHTPSTCPSCGPSSPFTFPSLPELARHRTTTCPGKLILCQFCHLEVPQEGDPLDPASEAETVISGLTAHERADGARTTDCHLCGAIVRLRDMAAHSAHHELDKVARANTKPAVCRDELCGRTLHGVGPRGQINGGTRMGQGPGNDLGLCSICFGPLYVSMHDPEGKALRRRIERRYLGQIMSGCGKPWCANEWCKTGRAKQGLAPLGGGAAAALPVVRPFLEEIGQKKKPMHFCVDETAQRRRKMAEMLAAEGVWEVEWCVAALEAEGGDLVRARGWLADWAPTKVDGRR